MGLGLGAGVEMVILGRASEWGREVDKSEEAKHSLAAGSDFAGTY